MIIKLAVVAIFVLAVLAMHIRIKWKSSRIPISKEEYHRMRVLSMKRVVEECNECIQHNSSWWEFEFRVKAVMRRQRVSFEFAPCYIQNSKINQPTERMEG